MEDCSPVVPLTRSNSPETTEFSDGVLAESIGTSDVQEWLDAAQEKILNWDSERSLTWDSEPVETSEFTQAVDEVRCLTESLEAALLKSPDPRARQIQDQASSILEVAMERLEEEFIRILTQHRQSLDFGRMSFHSTEEDHTDYNSYSSFNDESFELRFPTESARSSNRTLFELVEPTAISDLKCIADLMFRSGYNRECSQAYIATRKGVLDEFFSSHRLEILSTEELVALDFCSLGSKIKRWNHGMKAFTQVYLPSERKLCDLIFGDYPGPASATCFSGISKGSLFQLLGFGEAIAISPPKPENLFGLLDMYEGLADLMPEIRDFFSPEGSPASISTECHEVLRRIGESVKASFNEFKNAIRKKTSNTPFPGGGPVHLTKYVMNYIGVIPKYRQTLCLLLEGQHDREEEEDGGGEVGSGDTSPLRRSLLSVAAILEENLRIRSKLYEDAALQHFFMMNNIHYMMKKVRECDIHELFGDDWMRAQSVQVHQHALHYQRESWSSVLNFFKDDGIYSPGSNQPSTAVLKERFKSFNLAFEEIYKTQTGWLIPDDRLRDDVVISISLNILQAYRNFKGRYEAYLTGQRRREKYIKFTVDDLQNYLLDFFLGSPKALHLPRRA
ncbi:unnamed protein product [Spirodela intermedia]|uniref:Exocyst subunit Exo70 family protein n=1 Tax=Spirodela intermedia TaxID=51605 RepID=A0A7I8K8W3_SPIIN|nr:unnamed protein product [Spirodela intermedia]